MSFVELTAPLLASERESKEYSLAGILNAAGTTIDCDVGTDDIV